MTRAARRSLSRFRTPKYWPLWIGIGLLRLSCLLPYRAQIAAGMWFGRVARRVARRRRAIALRNLEICFPELAAAERDALLLRHFESLGASLVELALARWASEEKLLGMTRIEGAEHVREWADKGVGVILLSAHFTTIEISGATLRKHLPPFDAVYRESGNALITEFLRSTRLRSARAAIEKNDIKSMVRSLREGTPVWYAPDQAYNRKQSALLPFFGVPAMTNTATSALARLGKAVVIPFFPRRLPEGGYLLRILPPLAGVQGEDPEHDTMKYVAALEEHIRSCPDQYYWVHRKFKYRPGDLPDAYADLEALK